MDNGGGVISGLVLDELAYRLVLAWLRDDGDDDPLSTYRTDTRKAMRAARRRLTAAWRAVDSLALELQPTEHAVVTGAKSLMAQPGLAPRDAFHAAHALEAGCNLIASSDSGFNQVSGLRRLAPDMRH
jgi:predicted nucleic acid-binding protein